MTTYRTWLAIAAIGAGVFNLGIGTQRHADIVERGEITLESGSISFCTLGPHGYYYVESNDARNGIFRNIDLTCGDMGEFIRNQNEDREF